MRNIALLLAYDGTDFVGSQWQNQGRSIQGALEAAWEELNQERRRFTLAGRTDAGVHAHSQVANVRGSTRHPLTTVVRGMNALLPADVRVLAAREVDSEFHARHSAILREYRYLLDVGTVALPTLRHLALHVEGRLDVAAMAEALPLLEGTHDFAAFTVQSPHQKSTVRTLYRARLAELELLGHRLLAVELAANAFLQHMVRVIVGTILQVGRGRMSAAELRQVLERRDRRAAGRTAPAHGLTLTAVHYPASLLCWE
ncbi:tRNA pseudouridine(38-40) synthase TruA [Candidatus Viridilinea mediisalina]|uniref:tRNA pseudouridine synthase A n=1 Tax=Candidatus Viridilinea mediisalina TaxID=2024553 RepID=A0A2A6RMU7_9CHLR|nr:tRNA pseudouridine(38-40) synthase TruA [Candidatus Viridilinea mediisalina]PDW04180.1 tRNA pseudouridine(38-40) synthase TruA [Candidatus Viridilinea mediisalina]